MSRSTNEHMHADTKNTGHAPSPVELNRALSDPTRLRIVSVLSTGAKSLGTITKELGFDKKKKPIVRKHLKELKKRNLVFQVERGLYCLTCPELTKSILGFLEKSCIEFYDAFSSLVEARKAYNTIVFEDSEKNRLDFEAKFDRIFRTTFSQVGGELRVRYIDMARTKKYDFSRLRKI